MLGQRRYERVAFYCPLQLDVLPNGPVVAGHSVDISIAGVGVVTPIVLERGQHVRVRFSLHNGTNEAVDEDVLGRIAYSLGDEDGGRLGIEFLATIQEATQPVLLNKLNSL